LSKNNPEIVSGSEEIVTKLAYPLYSLPSFKTGPCKQRKGSWTNNAIHTVDQARNIHVRLDSNPQYMRPRLSFIREIGGNVALFHSINM